MINIKECIKEFNLYTKKFNLEDPLLKQRYAHTFRVMENAKNIAISLNLSDEEILLASLIGLLHDIGRFYQLEKYQNINDTTTINHGEYGVQVLNNDNYLDKYTTNKDYQKIIKTSILNHNKLSIDKNLSNKELLFSKIIRDADKLDILYIIGKDNLFSPNINEVTEKAKEYFYNKEVLPYNAVISEGDRVLVHLCYIYDIYFDYTIKKIKENKLYEKIYKTTNNKEILQEYFKYIEDYINERMIKC